jgi:hypothetical protein
MTAAARCHRRRQVAHGVTGVTVGDSQSAAAVPGRIVDVEAKPVGSRW